MCGKATIVYERCDCVRCFHAGIYDPYQQGPYYPHYDTNVVDGRQRPFEFSYVLVDPRYRCDSAVIDAEDHYVACDNLPEVVDSKTVWPGPEGTAAGCRFCDECKNVCLGLRGPLDMDLGPSLVDQLDVSVSSSDESAKKEIGNEANKQKEKPFPQILRDAVASFLGAGTSSSGDGLDNAGSAPHF
ncbi:hypothetical protein ANO14919_013520 [Xylariales sp. No.14919]|nr:hypothetical protein ANO14919_013520 [Xylariales sp. No.14919]